MGAFLLRRLALLVPILLGVSIVVFTLIRLIPGDGAMLAIGVEGRITPEQRALIRKEWGLDESQPVQYVRWLQKLTLEGDLGQSLRTKRPITDELRLRLPVTFELTILAGVIGTIPAVFVGVLSAVRRNSWVDYVATVVTLIGVSMPSFLLATLLLLVFSFWLEWLPPIGYAAFTDDPVQNLKFMILPAASLSLPFAAIMMRNTRSAVLEVLDQDHVRVARAKGLRARSVLSRHVLKNASIPIVTVGSIQLATLLGGTIIIEKFFSLPGMGNYIYQSISTQDYPVVQGVTLVMAAIFVLISMLTDVMYAVLDPRLRRQSG